MYRLLLRSCKRMGVFVISPWPSFFCWSRCWQQGSFAPRPLRRFAATTGPSATLSPSTVFLGSPVIRLPCFRHFHDGTRRASPVAQHVLVTVLSLPPRRSVMTFRSARVMSCCLRPEAEGSASGSKFCFEATCGFTFAVGIDLACASL
jgi:hypothetical protein